MVKDWPPALRAYASERGMEHWSSGVVGKTDMVFLNYLLTNIEKIIYFELIFVKPFFNKEGNKMPEEQVGVIVKFFAKPSVAAIEVTSGTIKKGDLLKYVGHTTDFTEQVGSMELDNQPIEEAKVGDLIGVKVKERVRENDKVYKVVGE